MDESRRKVLKIGAYVAPVILTMKVMPSFASNGSGPGPSSDTGTGNNDSVVIDRVGRWFGL